MGGESNQWSSQKKKHKCQVNIHKLLSNGHFCRVSPNLKGIKCFDLLFCPNLLLSQPNICALFERNRWFELYHLLPGSAWFSHGHTLKAILNFVNNATRTDSWIKLWKKQANIHTKSGKYNNLFKLRSPFSPGVETALVFLSCIDGFTFKNCWENLKQSLEATVFNMLNTRLQVKTPLKKSMGTKLQK